MLAMVGVLQPVRVEPTVSELAPIQAAYDVGRFQEARRLAEALAPLPAWGGVGGAVLAGRLAFNLGADALGQALHLRAWRRDRTAARSRYFHLRVVLVQRGALMAAELLPDLKSEQKAEQNEVLPLKEHSRELKSLKVKS